MTIYVDPHLTGTTWVCTEPGVEPFCVMVPEALESAARNIWPHAEVVRLPPTPDSGKVAR